MFVTYKSSKVHSTLEVTQQGFLGRVGEKEPGVFAFTGAEGEA